MNNHERIFDRNNYQKKTMDCFEVLAAYFVDIFYNHLFIEGKKLRTNKSVSSITEGYKHALNAFLQGIENPKSYKKILVGIHEFFISSGFTSMSFSDCIERVTEEFIPKDYYESVSKQRKISILKLVICQSNKTFIEKLVKNYLSLVIDTHNDVDNIRILQDAFIDILMLERENIYHRFITTTKSNPQAGLVEAMQTEIKNLCKEKFELKKITTTLKKIIINKENDLCDIRSQLEHYAEKSKRLQIALDAKPTQLAPIPMQRQYAQAPQYYTQPVLTVQNINPELETEIKLEAPVAKEMRAVQENTIIYDDYSDHGENEFGYDLSAYNDKKSVSEKLSGSSSSSDSEH